MALPLNSTTVDGTPVVWAEGPPPFAAGLVFGVGRVHETLLTNGITHLVEHLAIGSVAPGLPASLQYNGFVDLITTGFHAVGRPDRVLDFVSALSGALADLPVDRLATETAVLRVEGAQGNGLIDRLLSIRYGAAGPGLIAHPEFGLARVDGDAVRQWAAQWFTAGNAAVWMTGEPPSSFSLSLPPGTPERLGPPTPLPLRLPAWTTLPGPGVGIGMVAPRSGALASGSRLLTARARARLRTERGISYHVDTSYDDMPGHTAHLTVMADNHPDHAVAAISELLGVVREVMITGPTDDEVAADVEMMVEQHEAPDSVPGRLIDAATFQAVRGEPLDEDEVVARVAALTPAEVSKALRHAFATAIVAVPDNVQLLDDPSLTPLPDWSERRLAGRSLRRTRKATVPKGTHLVVTDEGATIDFGDDQVLTVTYDECEALLTTDKGEVVLCGRDGTYLELCPDCWKDGDAVLARVRAAVPADRHVTWRTSGLVPD